MKGQIRTKEKCPKCGNKFEGNPLNCTTCLTAPQKFYIDIYEKGYGQLKIYSDKTGHPLDSFERSRRVLESVRYEIDQHIFNPTKYTKSNIKDFLFENRIEEWYSGKSKEVEKNILAASYTRKLRCYIDLYFLPFFTGADIRDIRTYHIKNFYDNLPSDKNPNYLRTVLTSLENFFNVMFNYEYISQKPKFPKIRVDEKIPKWVDEETRAKFFELIPPEDRPIFLFLAYQAVRPGEAQALKKKDVNFNEKYVLIARTFSDQKIRERVKSKVVRPRLINPVLIPLLKELCKNKFPDNFVFLNPRTQKPYTRSSMFRIFEKARKQLNLEINLYQLTRHSLASIASNSGVPLQVIQKALGHTDIRTTLKYAHINLEGQKAMFEKPPVVSQLMPALAPD